MPNVVAKPAAKSWTVRFNGLLAALGAVAAFAPTVLEAVPGLANTNVGRGVGTALLVIGAVNVALRKRTDQPMTLRGGEVKRVEDTP